VDQINANLDRISELSDDELKSLEGSIVSEFEAVQTQDLTPDVVESMKALARAAVAVRTEVQTREAQAKQLAMEAAEAAEAIKGIDPDQDGDVDNVIDTDGDADAVGDGDGDGSGDADTVSEAIEGIADVDNDDVASDAAPSEDTNTDSSEAAPADAADMADEAPAPSTDADPAPAAPDTETPSSDEDPAQGGTDTPEQGDLSDEDEKKIANFDAAAPADATDEADAAPAADDASEAAAAAPADGDNTPAEAPAADEAAEMSDNGPDEDPEPAPSDSADEDAEDKDKKNNSEDPVTASVTTELDNIEVQAPADHAPVVASAAVEETISYAPVTITAGADIPGVTAGTELPNLRSVAEAIIKRKNAMGRTSGGDGEHHQVAQFATSFPEERTLNPSDIEGNRAKIEGTVDSLIAAGGIAAPAEVRYELYGLGEDVRPVKDSLPVFGADRGGIRYITPPVLTDLNGAVSLWTLDDDVAAATGSSPVKPALRVAAGAEVVVQVDAIPLILTFGNMGARAYPELVERHTKLGMIQHARFAETRILTRIGSLSTAVTAAKALGAARDIFVQVETAAAAYRNRHRMDESTPLRAIFPAWFKNALRADLTKQLPGDGPDETFGLAEATINNWFNLRGINVTWTVDGETGQIFGAQGAGALNGFPTELIWYLFSEGTFLFLDQGTLDLGIVRDSTLNQTNDYKIFFETFEAVAKVGIESLKVTSELAIAGATAGTVAPVI
jgi:hypothetical protein